VDKEEEIERMLVSLNASTSSSSSIASCNDCILAAAAVATPPPLCEFVLAGHTFTATAIMQFGLDVNK
jgi:hypothetical protein